MPHIPFDDSILTWHKLDWLAHVWYYVYDVDRKNGIVDALFKFAPNSKAMLHQHKTPYVTLVLLGALRFYRPNGELKGDPADGQLRQGRRQRRAASGRRRRPGDHRLLLPCAISPMSCSCSSTTRCSRRCG